MSKRLLILGASGGVGRRLVEQAAFAGHDVTAVVRPSSGYASDGVRVVRAEILEPGVLHGLVEGQDAVLSCLGQRRASLFPYSRLLSPPDLMAQVCDRLVPAMNAHGVSRVLAVSAAGVGDSASVMNGLMSFLIRTSTIGTAYADLAVMESKLMESGLDWTAPRPVALTNGPATGGARVVEGFGMTAFVSRADVADWMLRHLDGCEHRTPMIG